MLTRAMSNSAEETELYKAQLAKYNQHAQIAQEEAGWNASRVVSASFRSQKWLRMGRRNPDAVRGDCADHRQLLVHGLGTAELMRACAEGTARRNSGDGCSYRRLGTS